MQAVQNTSTSNREGVLVFHGDEHEGVTQPRTFRCCPLGVQLYNRRKLPTYELVEFTLEFPEVANESGQVLSCTGIVAQCQFEKSVNLYRIWVKFLDLPESVQDRLRTLTQALDLLCPFCENFSPTL